MPTLEEKQSYGTVKIKESMPTEYYPRRLTDLPKKKSKDQRIHKNQD